jgi:cytochrome b
MKRILVWDIPTRLFHVLLAASFTVAWLSSESDQWLSVHTFFGYLMCGLIGFRLIRAIKLLIRCRFLRN